MKVRFNTGLEAEKIEQINIELVDGKKFTIRADATGLVIAGRHTDLVIMPTSSPTTIHVAGRE